MSRFHGFMTASAAALSLLLAAQANAYTLKVGITSNPASLSPAKITGGTWEEDVLRDIYAGLVDVSADGKVIPGVAERWEVSEDGLTWTFHLRESKWSDGSPVTADDFAFSLRYFVTPQNAATGVERLYPIVNAEDIARGKASPDTLGVESKDEGRTLVIHLRERTPYFAKMLVLYPFYPMPHTLVEKLGDRWSQPDNIVTNGAFKPASWTINTELATVKNPNYYDAEHVALDGVNFYPTEDRNAGVTRLRAGGLDILRDFPASRLNELKGLIPDAVHVTPRLGTYYYTMNLRDGQPTADRRVREALSLAIQRELITSKLLSDSVQPAYALVPPGTSDYTNQPLAELKNDPQKRLERAKALLAEAGYGPNKPLTLKLTYNNSPEHKRIAVAIAAMWKQIGVNTSIENAEANVHYSNMRRGQFQIGRAAWLSSYDDAQNFLQLTYTEGNNYGNYQNPRFRELYEAANRAKTPEERRELMQKAEKQLADDIVLIPIYYYAALNLVNPGLKGWQDNAIDVHPSRWISHP